MRRSSASSGEEPAPVVPATWSFTARSYVHRPPRGRAMRVDSEIARPRGAPRAAGGPPGPVVMVTIDDLRSSAVALDWHEAVAVAAALAGHVAAAPRTIGAP